MVDLGIFSSVLSELVVATVLSVAGIAKLISGRSFHRTLELIPWVPRAIVGGLSVFIPIVELVVGVLFFTPWSLVASWGAGALFLGFSFPVTWAVMKGHRVPCACFGAISTAVFDENSLVRLGFLLALAMVPVVSGHAVNLGSIPLVTLLTGFAVIIHLLLTLKVGAELVRQIQKLVQ